MSRGNVWVPAIDLGQVIELLGLDESTQPALDADQLLQRLDTILAGAQRFTRQFSVDELGYKLPNRDRSYGVIAHHVFQIPLGFLEAVSTNTELTYERLVRAPGPDQQTPGQIADFGDEIRSKLADWQDAYDVNMLCKDPMATYWGEQSMHEVLERTTWHSGQHVRQLMSLLETCGKSPDQPLPESTWADLPMPKNVWD